VYKEVLMDAAADAKTASMLLLLLYEEDNMRRFNDH
jgi:hypothetical protein